MKKTISAKNVAERLGVGVQMVYRMARADEIPHFTLRNSKGARLFFYEDEIEQWLESRRKAVTA